MLLKHATIQLTFQTLHSMWHCSTQPHLKFSSLSQLALKLEQNLELLKIVLDFFSN